MEITGAKGLHIIPFLFNFGMFVKRIALYILEVLLSKLRMSLCPTFTEYIFSFGKLNEPSCLSYIENLLILDIFILLFKLIKIININVFLYNKYKCFFI